LWVRVTAPPLSAPARAILANGAGREITVNGRRVVTWRWGSGRPVILVHGWGGYGGQYHAMIEGLTNAGFQAITFDAPSHGQSAPGALGPRYATLFEFADALRAIARDTPDLAGIVAHSGGCAAVAWALRTDTAFAPPRLVFVAPFARVLRYMKLFQRAIGLSDEGLRRFQRSTETQFGFSWAEFEVPEMAARMRTPPVLVVHDKDDRETSWQDGADIAAAWPNATLRTTTGLGHVRILRDANVVREIVDYIAAS
jgi:pimeloyl-ACP methyl ester carboxylesterase